MIVLPSKVQTKLPHTALAPPRCAGVKGGDAAVPRACLLPALRTALAAVPPTTVDAASGPDVYLSFVSV